MEDWIYNNPILEGHTLYPRCNSTLNEVSNRDYPNTNYFNPEIKCLDMDTYEHSLRKAQSNHTVDAVIGISTYENNHALNSRLLLVELRMRYQSTAHLVKADMEAKVSYTKSLLGAEKTINRESVFVFSDSMAPQARSWFQRQSRMGGEIRYGIVCSVTDFATVVKSVSDFPYKPIHSEEDIKNSVLQYKKNAEWGCFFSQIKHWCKKAESYRYKNSSEHEHIVNVVKMVWGGFIKSGYILSDDELLEQMIMEEDFEYLKNITPHVNS